MHDRCKEIVRDIVEHLDKREFHSETDVRRGIVDPLLQEVGWPVHRPRVVEREYRVEDGRVDYALCPKGKPLVFIEAKRPGGITPAGRKQLFGYCTAHGVPVAVLTDGREWHFYLLLRPGTPDERRLPPIDLSSDTTEVCTKLRRYLEYPAVTSGKNIEAATRDLEQVRFERVCQLVWHQLVEAPSDDFVELFEKRLHTREIERHPSREDVVEWIRERIAKRPTNDLVHDPPDSDQREPPDVGPPKHGDYVTWRGERKSFSKQNDAMQHAFQVLQKADPDFCRRFGERYRGHKKLWVADRRELRSAEFRAPKEVANGWHVETALQAQAKVDRIRKACRVAGFGYGNDKDMFVRIGGHS